MTDATEYDHTETAPTLRRDDSGEWVNISDPAYWRQCYEAALRREDAICQVLQDTRNRVVELQAECDKRLAICNALAAEVKEAHELFYAEEEENRALKDTIIRLVRLHVTDEVGYGIDEEEEV